MTEQPLSAAAQAVKNAVLALYADENVHQFGWQLDASTVAAALRAAAGCAPKEEWGNGNYATGFRDGIAFSCQFLHELAAELEDQ
jgi:hypothetical protein